MNTAGVTQIIPQGIEYIRILPEIVLSLFGMVIMVLDPLVDDRGTQKLLGLIALIGSVAATHYSFMGATDPVQMEPYARDVASRLKADGVDAVLLSPV